jgi:hypothetical protein
MAKLKINMFGVCLATPLKDRDKPETVDRLTVVTPCSPRSRLASDGLTQIDALFTYLIVKSDNVASGSPRRPDHVMREGTVSAFILHREEVTLSGDKGSGVQLPYGEAGFPDAPSKNSRDPRWICNLPSLLPGSGVKPEVLHPVGETIPAEVCTRLVARSGVFTGEFPCGTPKARTAVKNSNIERYFAQQMALTVELEASHVSLVCTPFDPLFSETRIDLRSLGGNDLEMYFAMAPIVTMEDVAASNSPCDITNQHHETAEFDYEFEVLWDLLNLPKFGAKPVPRLVEQEGPRVDCIPGGG